MVEDRSLWNETRSCPHNKSQRRSFQKEIVAHGANNAGKSRRVTQKPRKEIKKGILELKDTSEIFNSNPVVLHTYRKTKVKKGKALGQSHTQRISPRSQIRAVSGFPAWGVCGLTACFGWVAGWCPH